jgi:hypothetical protein
MHHAYSEKSSRFWLLAKTVILYLQRCSTKHRFCANIPRSYQTKGFRAEVDSYVMKQLIFLDNRTDAFSQTRSAARISRDNMRDYCFHVAVDGIIETVTGSLKERK